MINQMSIHASIEKFLQRNCQSLNPWLLALSGGPDSIYLFHCLLFYRQFYGVPFQVAHIDHGWRKESQIEAEILEQLAKDHQVPFHLKKLDPALLKGNLEASCREERYHFFAELCAQFHFQAVLTGHHQNDQTETVFKRILEGAHWSKWGGLESCSSFKGMRILRPLLEISKQDIYQFLNQNQLPFFEDSTNVDVKFLRARLRQKIFPWLNDQFGKQIESSFIKIGEDAQELNEFFRQRLLPLLDEQLIGPWGVVLDLYKRCPETLLEIKYLVRLMTAQQDFFLSRPMLKQVAEALQAGQAYRRFLIGAWQVVVDRYRIFILFSHPTPLDHFCLNIQVGTYQWGRWRLDVSQEVYNQQKSSSWKEGWQGQFLTYLPMGDYTINCSNPSELSQVNLKKLKKNWAQAKVPSFLHSFFPFIEKKSLIYHEFLTGNSLFSLSSGSLCWKVVLSSI